MSRPERVSIEVPSELTEHLITKHNLRTETGLVVCWNCRYRPATLPTLFCVSCLAAHRKDY